MQVAVGVIVEEKQCLVISMTIHLLIVWSSFITVSTVRVPVQGRIVVLDLRGSSLLLLAKV